VGRRLLFYAVLYPASLFGYMVALKWAHRGAERLNPPGWWMRLWIMHLSHNPFGPWEALTTLGAVVVASIPIGLLLSRFGGRHAPLAALGIQLAALAIALLTVLIYDGVPGQPPKLLDLLVLIQVLTLMLVLPTTVLVLRKLPSNNRWRGP